MLNRIPFVLYDRNVVAQRVDAHYKNSLDFAPTLLHWLRIKEGYNYFLGCSLYDESCPYNFEYVYACKRGFFYTNGGRADVEVAKKIADFYNLSENMLR